MKHKSVETPYLDFLVNRTATGSQTQACNTNKILLEDKITINNITYQLLEQ